MTRRGLSHVELLVVLAILATLTGLLLPAVQSVRDAGWRTGSRNHLRQIALAMHHYASDHAGALPNDTFGRTNRSRLMALLPYLGERMPHPKTGKPVPTFVSPADPTAGAVEEVRNVCSYGANWQVFRDNSKPYLYGKPDLPATFADGTAATILLAEHYAVCGSMSFTWLPSSPMTYESTGYPAVFADIVYPVAKGAATVSSEPGKTFQTRPCPGTPAECGAREACDFRLAQTPHVGGMLVAMADGSVRTVAPTVSEQTFWAAVTPAAGDVLGGDW
jgi:hypothetical protein